MCTRGFAYKDLKCGKDSYIVKKGDTCSTIIDKFAIKANDSFDTKKRRFSTANKNMICDNSFLFVGQKICLAWRSWSWRSFSCYDLFSFAFCTQLQIEMRIWYIFIKNKLETY
jgi:hypothetical protein